MEPLPGTGLCALDVSEYQPERDARNLYKTSLEDATIVGLR